MNKASNMKIENWCGREIRFVEKDEQWWALLLDLCLALDLNPHIIERELSPDFLTRIYVSDQERWHRAVNEEGIYQLLLKSRIFEANKFRLWSAGVMKKLRKMAGLEEYEVMRMLDSDIQESIDDILDTIYYDEETGKLMRSITVAGGDVEQVEFE